MSLWELKYNDIEACGFSYWYPRLKKLNCTVASSIIELPNDFVEYLLADGVVLPEGVEPGATEDGISDDEELKEVLNTSSEVPRFEDLNAEIRKAIKALGGEVTIKLNWSAPIDAVWINCGTHRCRTLSEIYMLLKASDRVTFDLEHMYSKAKDSPFTRPPVVTLVLRRWKQISISMEFRCFVYNKMLIGICQRDCSTFYAFLCAEKATVVSLVAHFFESVVRAAFPLETYTFDVFIDTSNKVWLIDFNVFGSPTHPLLFDWNEIIQSHVAADADADVEVEYRIVQSHAEVLPSESGLSRGPIDVSESADFSNFMKICSEQQKRDDSEDSDA